MTRKYNRIIGIGDLHGCFDLLKNLIVDQIQFNPEHDLLVVLGDVIDRGKDSKGAVLYLQALRQKYPDNIVLLKGNHEDIAYNFFTQTDLDKRSNETLWLAVGGDKTLSNFESIDEAKELLLPFIESLKLYHETPTHIFVHAGVPYGKTLETATTHELLWGRGNSYRGDKTLVVGHNIHREVTKHHNKLIALDTGAFHTGKLSAYDILNDKIYQAVVCDKSYELKESLFRTTDFSRIFKEGDNEITIL